MEIRGIVLFLDANYTNYTDVFLCDDLRICGDYSLRPERDISQRTICKSVFS